MCPGSNSAISPAYSGLPILGWAAIWDGTPRRLSSEGRQRIINTKRGLWSSKNNKEKKLFQSMTAGVEVKLGITEEGGQGH